MAKLNFMDRDNVLREYEIKEEVITIGREANNKYVIADSSVSRLHALIEKREDGYYLVDKNSSNGTFVNGKKVSSEQKLNHEDKVNLGNAALVFEDEAQIQATFILDRPEIGMTVEDRPTEAVSKPMMAPPPQAAPVRPTPPPPPPTPPPAVVKTPPPAPPPPVAPPPPKVEAAATICPSCKKQVEPKAKFCGFCGAPISAEKPAEVPKPAPIAPPPPPVKPAPAPAPPIPPVPKPAAPPVAAVAHGGLQYAGFGQRLAAYLIDVLIVFALCLIPYGIMMVAFLLPIQRQQEPGPMAAIVSGICGILILLIYVGYFVYFIGLKGATPGKKIMKLKVTLPDGAYPIGIGKALIRFIGYLISGSICYIGFLMALFDKEEHKALHDRIAGTRVIKDA